MGFCNKSLPIDERVTDLLSRLTRTEKLYLVDRVRVTARVYVCAARHAHHFFFGSIATYGLTWQRVRMVTSLYAQTQCSGLAVILPSFQFASAYDVPNRYSSQIAS